MKTPLDHMIKEVLAEVADAPPPSGLAKAAVRRANRRRTAERAGVGTLAVLAVVLAGIPFAVRATGDGTSTADQPVGPLSARPAPAVTASPAPGAPALPEPAVPVSPPPLVTAPPAGGWVVTAYSGIEDPDRSGELTSLLLDRRTGRYEQVPYLGVAPSPDGTQALVTAGDESDQTYRTGLLDLRTDELRWLPDNAAEGVAQRMVDWSPDGKRILISYRPGDRRGGFLIVDARTLSITTVGYGDAGRDTTAHNSLGLGFMWVPNREEVALALSRATGGDVGIGIVDSIRFYDLTGRALRTVPIEGGWLNEGPEFSPDGRRLALADLSRVKEGRSEIRVIDAATGETTHTLTTPAARRVIGWYDDRHLMLDDLPVGSESVSGRLSIVDLSGRNVRIVPLRKVRTDGVHVGSADGLTGAAAKLAF